MKKEVDVKQKEEFIKKATIYYESIGKTSHEIASILRVSESKVVKYMSSMRGKY